jgi:hypothetical protein
VTGMTAVITEPCLVPARQGPVLRGPAADRPVSPVGDRSSVADRPQAKAVRSWPLLVLAVPAGAEVWSGWVGIAQMTGFGRVSPLPGIWPSLHLDTTVTLPVGVEAYAAYALRAWLDTSPAVSDRTRRFARRSAIFSFALGMAGQVAYHLLAQAGAARAPWIITTIVSCLPVLVLAMGTTLAHMLRTDAETTRDNTARGPAEDPTPDRTAANQGGPDQNRNPGHRAGKSARSPDRARKPGREPASLAQAAQGASGAHPHEDQARLIARQLAADGASVSRRALRSAGATGSNESLNAVAREINAKPAATGRNECAPPL